MRVAVTVPSSPGIKAERLEFDKDDWAKERSVWGWLGKPPPEVLQGSAEIQQRWKDLSKRAAKVAKMSSSQGGVDARRLVASQREGIIQAADREAMERHSKTRPPHG